MEEDVRIERVAVKDLAAFAARPRAGVVPISKVRARAQVKNPHADPNDVGLVVAYQGERTIGFLGLLPAFFVVDAARTKMSWLSTWYVAPEHRRLAAGA